MNYWKLGCNWGRGAPDFYPLLRDKRIVICGDHSMAKDDWVLICQGHDAAALAKIGSAPVPSTARADLGAEFERLQITYDETNLVADAAEYLIVYLRLTQVARVMTLLMTGNTLPRILLEDVLSLPVPIPPCSVQDRIASMVSSFRTEARKLKADATAALDAAKRKIENVVKKQ